MSLSQLTVFHREKKKGVLSPFISLSGVRIESCLREILITTAHHFSATHLDGLEDQDITHFSDEEAYEKLLLIASGLESEIVGETDIFGQFKSQFISEFERGNAVAKELFSTFQRLMEDTKEIRSQYLQGVGGASYGSLARMLIQPKAGEKILIIGAGQLAQTVAPFFQDETVLVWNRSEARIHEFLQKVKSRSTSFDLKPFQPDQEELAWSEADHVVICVPGDDEMKRRYALWNQKGKVLHLGCLKHQQSAWEGCEQFLCLDDLFDLQRAQTVFREAQVSRARKACASRAKLRALSTQSIAHGWEDLLAFA